MKIILEKEDVIKIGDEIYREHFPLPGTWEMVGKEYEGKKLIDCMEISACIVKRTLPFNASSVTLVGRSTSFIGDERSAHNGSSDLEIDIPLFVATGIPFHEH